MSYIKKDDFIKNFKRRKALDLEKQESAYDFSDTDALGLSDKVVMNNCEYKVKSPKGAPIVFLEDCKGLKIAISKNEMAYMIYKGYAKLPNTINKATGEGSRGGHVIGHHPDGTPIYPKRGYVMNGRQFMADNSWHDIKTGNRHPDPHSDKTHSFISHDKDKKRAKEFTDYIHSNYHDSEHDKLKVQLAKYVEAKHQAKNIKNYIKEEGKVRELSNFDKERYHRKVDQVSNHFKKLTQSLKSAKKKGDE
jgi:hypothetical protein